MNIHQAFPTKFVAAPDLMGQAVPLTIDRVVMEDVGSEGEKEFKPVVYFSGMRKGLVLNKTNAVAIADAYGDETDAWRGRGVILYPTETDFRGKSTPCIRVRIPIVQPPRVAPPPPPQPVVPAPAAAGVPPGVQF